MTDKNYGQNGEYSQFGFHSDLYDEVNDGGELGLIFIVIVMVIAIAIVLVATYFL